MTAIVPVVIPPTTPATAAGPLNFLYSVERDMSFNQQVHIKAPLYVQRATSP